MNVGGSAACVLGDYSQVLRIDGLPFSAAAADIRAFFKDFTLVEMVICTPDGEQSIF